MRKTKEEALKQTEGQNVGAASLLGMHLQASFTSSMRRIEESHIFNKKKNHKSN